MLGKFYKKLMRKLVEEKKKNNLNPYKNISIDKYM